MALTLTDDDLDALAAAVWAYATRTLTTATGPIVAYSQEEQCG